MNICPLCNRPLEGSSSLHHLTPILKGGKKSEKVKLHQICHDKIHSVFTETELANRYNTIELLIENEEVRKFIKWISNKPNNFNDPSKRYTIKKGWR